MLLGSACVCSCVPARVCSCQAVLASACADLSPANFLPMVSLLLLLLPAQALSRHERLDCPLPQATAVQVPRLMGHPSGCSSMHLHSTLLEALADLGMHSAGAAGWGQPAVRSSSDSSSWGGINSLDHSSSKRSSSSSSSEDVGDGVSMVQGFRQQQQQQEGEEEEWCAPSLDGIEAAATAGPVGGAKAAYVAAKLLAAAAWKRLGFESDPLQSPLLSTTAAPAGRQALPVGESDSRGVDCARGLGVLLSSGGFLPSHHTIIHLLGGSAGVLQPVGRSTGTAPLPCADPGAQSAGQAGAAVAGWCPCLYHPVYQDIDLT